MRKRRARTEWLSSPLRTACLIGTIATLAIVCQADFKAPPRFDGAGYTVLATSLRQGTGYRAIDHPDRPRHAHFPPGYPLALALLGRIAGPSNVAAHAFSAFCAVAATMAAWVWYRRNYPREVAAILGLALAVNWVWTRTGSTIQSEPLYQLLCQLAILAVPVMFRQVTGTRAVLLGTLLAACFLTRQIAVGLVLAVFIHVVLSVGWRFALKTLLVVSLLLTPWLAWILTVRGEQGTQADLLLSAGTDLPGRAASQGLFYLKRIPDQFCGPLVEYATIVRPSETSRGLALVWAGLCTTLVFLGWFVTLRQPRRRLAAFISLATLALLIIWPYTEAGRFLVPLIPCLLIGAVEGLSILLAAVIRLAGTTRLNRRRRRLIAAVTILALSLPYTGYSVFARRGRPADASSQAFDAACAWLRNQDHRPGPVLTRHPGEVFLATGRQAIEVSTSERPGARDAEPESVAETIKRYSVVYLLIDDDRYLSAVPSPLGQFVQNHPERVRPVGSWGSRAVASGALRSGPEPLTGPGTWKTKAT